MPGVHSRVTLTQNTSLKTQGILVRILIPDTNSPLKTTIIRLTNAHFYLKILHLFREILPNF